MKGILKLDMNNSNKGVDMFLLSSQHDYTNLSTELNDMLIENVYVKITCEHKTIFEKTGELLLKDVYTVGKIKHYDYFIGEKNLNEVLFDYISKEIYLYIKLVGIDLAKTVESEVRES